jgi:hypothetical protein
MNEYTHIHIAGDCLTPQRFWRKTPLTREQFNMKSIEKNMGGYVRELSDLEKKFYNNIKE